MENKKESKDINNTISLAEAMNRTNNFREAVKPLFNNKTELVPKGFFIHFEDLKALADLYPNASGARAYFTLPSPGFKIGEGISGILVPVEITADGIYKDIIINPNGETTEDDTSIYDFTKPCPPSCDDESPLC